MASTEDEIVFTSIKGPRANPRMLQMSGSSSMTRTVGWFNRLLLFIAFPIEFVVSDVSSTPETGSRIVNSTPPSLLVTLRLPFNSSIFLFVIDKPRPVPDPTGLVVKNGSKIPLMSYIIGILDKHMFIIK